jgi:hypothetical protein
MNDNGEGTRLADRRGFVWLCWLTALTVRVIVPTPKPLNGGRLLFDRFHSLRKPGEFLSPRACVRVYISFAQKIQCTFKVDIPDMGHLDGGHERDVRTQSCGTWSYYPSLRTSAPDRSKPKVRSNCHYGLLSSSYTRKCGSILALAAKHKQDLQRLRGLHRASTIQLARTKRAQRRSQERQVISTSRCRGALVRVWENYHATVSPPLDLCVRTSHFPSAASTIPKPMRCQSCSQRHVLTWLLYATSQSYFRCRHFETV